jgi:hypothetical protein
MRSTFLSPGIRIAALVAVITVASACADDPVVPSPGAPGDYAATRFAVSIGGPPVNLLAAGASISLTLAEDHTTTGRLLVPAVAGNEAIDESLTGTWRQSNDTVFFAGPADTFIRDVPFLLRGATLVADYSDGSGRLQVTLSK